MLYGILLAFYIIMCILLVLLILIQKGKSSMGLGGMGGGAQMLFGSSGGQDIFQKITWIFTGIFILGSLVLALMKTNERTSFKYLNSGVVAPKPLVNPTPSPDLQKEVTIPSPAAPQGDQQ